MQFLYSIRERARTGRQLDVGLNLGEAERVARGYGEVLSWLKVEEFDPGSTGTILVRARGQSRW